MIIEYYSTKKEFDDLKKKYHKLGYTLKFWDFVDIDGNNTTGQQGRLIFDNSIQEENGLRIFEQELLAKLDTKEINLDGIKELLKIKFGQDSYVPPKTLLEKLRFWS